MFSVDSRVTGGDVWGFPVNLLLARLKIQEKILLNELFISYARPSLQKKNTRKGPVPKTQTRIKAKKASFTKPGEIRKFPNTAADLRWMTLSQQKKTGRKSDMVTKGNTGWMEENRPSCPCGVQGAISQVPRTSRKS